MVNLSHYIAHITLITMVFDIIYTDTPVAAQPTAYKTLH